MEKFNEADETVHSTELPPKTPDADGLINPSGHRQELDRNFRLINICGLGVTTGNTWIALGGSIVCKFHSHSDLRSFTHTELLDCRNLQWRAARCHFRTVRSPPAVPSVCCLLT